jgi:hypothetical protein
MNHAALVNDVLSWSVILAALLLVTFVRASIRARYEPPPAPARVFPEPAEPAGAGVQAAPSLPKRVVTEPDYVARHAVVSGPPWGPAPKPPGVDW